MQLPYYVVDSFTSSVFTGNPAGVCMLDEWLSDETMQRIAAENRLSETAFLVGGHGRYDLRWFTPEVEVDLCGHATLASAFVLLRDYEHAADRLDFNTKAGMLTVVRDGDRLAMDFPSRPAEACAAPEALVRGLGMPPNQVLRCRDYLAVFDTEEDIRRIAPDITALNELDCLAIIITAPGKHADFVSRVFAPRAGVDEDPVTGSTHCTLIPYWAEKLAKRKLHARQLSRRGGEIFCEYRDDRCIIAGHAALYLRGTIML